MKAEKVAQFSETVCEITCTYADAPAGLNVNVAASAGKDGILLVDTAWAQTAEKLGEVLDGLDHGKAKLIIATHPHGDHIGGIPALGQEAVVIAHKNAQNEVLGAYFALPALPGRDTPIITFEDSLSLRFNGEEIRLIHLPGHTGSDIVVHFVDSGVLCVGDLVFSHTYPGIDPARGGDINTYLQTLQRLIDLFPAGIKLVAGHATDYTMEHVKDHLRMAAATTELIKNALSAGKTADDMLADGLLKDWETWSTNAISTEAWIRQACLSLRGRAFLPIAEPLTHTLVQSGLQAAIEQYHDLKARQPEAFDFSENQLNLLGYQLLWRGMLPEAIGILKLNIEVYPRSANPYDSMGEVYLAAGERELAREYYQKALEINPGMASAREALQQISQAG